MFHSRISTLDLSEIKRYIDNIDFSKIIDRLVFKGGWLQNDALKTCQYYRNFLFLKKKYAGEKLPPSIDIDEFWHAHILDTKMYEKDCDAIFGFFLDHYPYFGIDEYSTRDDLNNAFARTQELHFNEFSSHIEATRSSRSAFLNYLLCKLARKHLLKHKK